MIYICKHCGKEYDYDSIVNDKLKDEDYCPECKILQNEQDERCGRMERSMPDEPLDWKEFEEDIMGFDFT